MARPKSLDTITQINVKLPGSLVRKVRVMLLDPVRGKVKYGAMAALMTKLLGDWIKEQEEPTDNTKQEEAANG